LKNRKLTIVLLLGLVAITGIVIVQVLWMRHAFSMEGRKFSEKVQISLLKTLERLYKYNNNVFPLQNPIQQISNDYYIVNVNNDFEADVLEYCLKSEFERANLLTDFEYAIYKCESDEMVYGNYVSFSGKDQAPTMHFPKRKGLVYYFAIRFPNESGYLLGRMQLWLALAGIMVVILLIYVYSIFTILRQKKYSDLQRDFINNMTHEFKTPLSSILIASTYLSKQEQIKADQKLGTYTGIIIDQSQKLNKHIEKILNIARWDDAPLELNKQTLKVVPIVQNIIDNIKLKHEHLVTAINSSSADLEIVADEFHFTNLVYNLLDNSVKYCEGEPNVEIKISDEDRTVRLEFTDNGIGIPKKDLSFVFDKFYRIQDKKRSEVNGFGLGLYYVKKVCLLHQWKINLFNNAEKGLTVSLQIPRT
jgi:two-component system phosphate regulon sensor histidine kinase PhoR